MSKQTTRRKVLAAGAGAFGYATLQAEPIRAAIPALAAYQAEGAGWTPRLLTPAQGELLATLCEHILPRTDTPGARDAGVHEFIDLELSLADGEDQLKATGGLDWIDRRAADLHGSSFVDLDAARQVDILREISDEHGARTGTRRRRRLLQRPEAAHPVRVLHLQGRPHRGARTAGPGARRALPRLPARARRRTRLAPPNPPRKFQQGDLRCVTKERMPTTPHT